MNGTGNTISGSHVKILAEGTATIGNSNCNHIEIKNSVISIIILISKELFFLLNRFCNNTDNTIKIHVAGNPNKIQLGKKVRP